MVCDGLMRWLSLTPHRSLVCLAQKSHIWTSALRGALWWWHRPGYWSCFFTSISSFISSSPCSASQLLRSLFPSLSMFVSSQTQALTCHRFVRWFGAVAVGGLPNGCGVGCRVSPLQRPYRQVTNHRFPCLPPPTSLIPCGAWGGLCSVAVCGPTPLLTLILLPPCALFSLWWLLERKASYAWVLQDSTTPPPPFSPPLRLIAAAAPLIGCDAM